jgi:aminocarboxymuconate-semialdehyde decarboxylase
MKTPSKLRGNDVRKIDVFNHIWPKKYYEALLKQVGTMTEITKRSGAIPMMVDLDVRFKVMDAFEGYQQILSLAAPPLDVLGGPEIGRKLSRIGSDGMAELCQKYPDRFPGFITSIALHDAEGAVEEARRAVQDLGACGIQIYTNVSSKPLDAPEFRHIFKALESLGKPVWIHPVRTAKFPDYQTEELSMYEIWWTFGWPYESSVAQARIVFSKMFDEMPKLKFIIHHAGGMTPFFEGRVGPGWDQLGSRTSFCDYKPLLKELKKRPLDYFKEFYVDTATFGSLAALECSLSFYGIDHVLFASDAPFDPEGGPMYIRETIRCIEALGISSDDREEIYYGNACRLLGIR